MLLGDISVDTFLKEYWQKKPLLIKNAFPNFVDPLSPEELAGLACEEEVESRIVSRTDTSDGDAWTLKNSPFQERDFTSLPKDDWTLLVQSVDHWFPEVKKLLDCVDFLPHWRIDDVMVSYAEKNAGVGPHFDYYDVFIIQGKGSRSWKIGQACDSQSELVSDSGLKILKHFQEQESWQLDTGDVLYIPPGVAHYGVSHDSSLSYSIGFRAPSTAEMLIGYSDEICASLSDDQRYNDLDLEAATTTGEISSTAIQKVEEMLLSSLKKHKALPTWFGKHVTEPKQEESILVPTEALSPKDLLLAFAAGETLSRHLASRFAFIKDKKSLTLFADGEAFPFKPVSSLLQKLNKLLNSDNTGMLDLSPYLDDPEMLNLLTQLYNQGSLVFVEDDNSDEAELL